MSKWLNNLRKKPNKEKKRILIIVLVLSMILVITVWVVDLKQNFFSGQKINLIEEKEIIKDKIGPFSALKESFGVLYKNIVSGIKNIK